MIMIRIFQDIIIESALVVPGEGMDDTLQEKRGTNSRHLWFPGAVGLFSLFLVCSFIFGIVAAAPVAMFSGVPTTGPAPLDVVFMDASTGTPTGWAWFFGDETYTVSWTQMAASATWTAREYQTSVVMPDGSIVLMGGWDSSGPKNDVWRSVDNGATWTLMTASAGWSARHAHSSVVMPDGSIVFMGGWDSSGPKNDVWRSTDNGATWTEMTASAEWSARLYHSSVVMPDGSIILMGGMGGRDGGSLTNDVWRSTDNGATWMLMTASAEWSTRSSHTSIAMPDGSIVLMGGYNYGYINDVWRSTNNGSKWTQVTASAGWTARSYHSSVAMPDGSIVLMDGWDGSRFKSDVWRLMPAGSSVQNPSHTYSTPGIYTVGLQTYNANGYTITLKTGYITVTSPVNPPVAALSGTPTSGNAPLTVQFTDTSSGSPTAWKWEYNSSSGWIQFSTIQNPAYTFSAGNYNIRLTATNAGGSSIETKIGYIIVNTGSATAAITSVSPVMTVAGRAAFPLTVKGKKFTMQSTVQWNGSERTTTYERPTHLKAVINANDIQTGGIALIQVYDPVRGTSNTASFTIKNLPPRITSLTPRRIPDMSPDTDVAVVGKNFNEQSVVLWNGETQTTRCISGTNLYFTINGTKLQIPGRANVTVFNPTPGGGVSGNRIFIIGKPI